MDTNILHTLNCLFPFCLIVCALRYDSGKVQQLGRVERKLEELWKGLQRSKALTKDCEKEVAELRDEKESCLQRLSTIEQDIEMVSLCPTCKRTFCGVGVARDPSVHGFY